MLSLYGKNNSPDHVPSFCGPPLATTSYPPRLPEPWEPSPAPIACGHHVHCVPYLPVLTRAVQGCVYSGVPLLPQASFGW